MRADREARFALEEKGLVGIFTYITSFPITEWLRTEEGKGTAKGRAGAKFGRVLCAPLGGGHRLQYPSLLLPCWCEAAAAKIAGLGDKHSLISTKWLWDPSNSGAMQCQAPRILVQELNGEWGGEGSETFYFLTARSSFQSQWIVFTVHSNQVIWGRGVVANKRCYSSHGSSFSSEFWLWAEQWM